MFALVLLYFLQGSNEFILARKTQPKKAIWRYQVGRNVQSREIIFVERGLVRVLVRQRFQNDVVPTARPQDFFRNQTAVEQVLGVLGLGEHCYTCHTCQA